MPEGYEYRNPYEEKISGKALDDEFDAEDELQGGEEVAADLRQAHEDVASNITGGMNETINDIIDTIEIHFDGSESWNELVDDLTELIERMENVDPEDAEDEFSQDLGAIHKTSLNLAKKKTN